MQKIIAGPFVGEFGWKLFCWQAHLRYLSDIGYEIHVIDYPQHSVLYDDFSTSYTEYSTYMHGDTSMANMWGFEYTNNSVIQILNSVCAIKTKFSPIQFEFNINQIIDNNENYHRYNVLSFNNGNAQWIPPNTEVINYNSHLWSQKNAPPKQFYEINQRFIQLKPNIIDQKTFDIAIHARSTNKGNSANKNWHMGNWLSLIDLIQKSKYKNMSICTIGDKLGSMAIPGIEDMRGIDLKNTIHILNNAKCLIGCPSGPINLAALCSCPRLLVIGVHEHLNRYTLDWNPFNVPVYITPHTSRVPSAPHASIVYLLLSTLLSERWGM